MEELARRLRTAEERLARRLDEASKLLGVEVKAPVELMPLKQDTIARLEEARRKLEEERRRVRAQVEEAAGGVSERERLLQELSLSPDRCPVCGRELSEEHLIEVVERLRRESEELRARLEELRCEEARLEEDLGGLARRLEAVARLSVDEVDELSREAAELSSVLEEARAELSAKLSELDKARRALASLAGLKRRVEELEPLHRKYLEAQGALKAYPPRDELVHQLRSAKAAFEELKARAEKLREDMAKLNYSPEAHMKLRRESEEAEASLRELLVKEAELKGRIDYLKAREAELRAKLAELKQRESERERRARFVELLETIRWSYSKDGLQRTIRARARPLIEELAREYLEKFNLEYSDLKLDEDFNPSLVGPLGEQPVDAISGGERVAVALALRLAIARALAGERLELMILDEPTTHLDEERRRELVEVLRRFFKEEPRVLPQLILVTHEREVEDAADAVYYVTREAGFSKVSMEPP